MLFEKNEIKNIIDDNDTPDTMIIIFRKILILILILILKYQSHEEAIKKLTSVISLE